MTYLLEVLTCGVPARGPVSACLLFFVVVLQPPEGCTAHVGNVLRGRVGQALHSRAGGLPGAVGEGEQVLAYCGQGRQRTRRPQPRESCVIVACGSLLLVCEYEALGEARSVTAIDCSCVPIYIIQWYELASRRRMPAVWL